MDLLAGAVNMARRGNALFRRIVVDMARQMLLNGEPIPQVLARYIAEILDAHAKTIKDVPPKRKRGRPKCGEAWRQHPRFVGRKFKLGNHGPDVAWLVEYEHRKGRPLKPSRDQDGAFGVVAGTSGLSEATVERRYAQSRTWLRDKSDTEIFEHVDSPREVEAVRERLVEQWRRDAEAEKDRDIPPLSPAEAIEASYRAFEAFFEAAAGRPMNPAERAAYFTVRKNNPNTSE